MTTIAYKDSIMASDSACSDDWQFLSRVVKIVRLASGGLFGAAGDADVRSIVDLLAKVKTPAGMPSKKQIEELETDFSAIVVLPKGRVYNVYCEYIDAGNGRWSGGLFEVLDGYYSVGSGAQAAMAALESGKSAKDAVLVACRRDFFSRPPVHVMPLLQPKAQRVKPKKAKIK
jgi:hypothetical protein